MSAVEIARSPVPAEIPSKYAGKWVALRDDEIVAAADDLRDLLADERVRPDDSLYRVPEPGAHFYS